MRRGIIVGIGLVMTALLVGLGSLVSVNAMARQTVREERTYAFRGNAVSIDLTVGEVEIVPSDKDDEISVRRSLTYGLRRPFVEERIDGATFKVRDGNCPMPVADCHVRWLLQVPRSLRLEIATKTGDITVGGMTGPVNLTSVSGAVKARALRGQTAQLLSYEGPVTGVEMRSTHVVATSRSGDVSVSFRTPPKLVHGTSTTGSVGVSPSRRRRGVPDRRRCRREQEQDPRRQSRPRGQPERHRPVGQGPGDGAPEPGQLKSAPSGGRAGAATGNFRPTTPPTPDGPPTGVPQFHLSELRNAGTVAARPVPVAGS